MWDYGSRDQLVFFFLITCLKKNRLYRLPLVIHKRNTQPQNKAKGACGESLLVTRTVKYPLKRHCQRPKKLSHFFQSNQSSCVIEICNQLVVITVYIYHRYSLAVLAFLEEFIFFLYIKIGACKFSLESKTAGLIQMKIQVIFRLAQRVIL